MSACNLKWKELKKWNILFSRFFVSIIVCSPFLQFFKINFHMWLKLNCKEEWRKIPQTSVFYFLWYQAL